MALLFDKQNNRVVDVADNLVNEALATGNYRFRSGVRIPVVAPNGETGTVLSDEMGDLVNKGFRYLTAEDGKQKTQESIEQIRKEEYGDRTGLALATGALRGATLGVSDVALSGLGVGEAALRLKQQNETASLVGEIGGGLAAILTPAGAGILGGTAIGRGAMQAARVLGAPTRIAAETAGQLGRQAATLAGATNAAGTLTRLGRVQAAVAGGAAEGLIIGAGQTLSEAALRDPELTAEKALANVGLGAVFGGTLGGLGRGFIEGADIGIKSGLQKLAQTEIVPKTAKEFAGRLGEIYGKAVNLSRGDFGVDEEAAKLWDRGNAEFRRQIVEHMADPAELNRQIAKNFDVVRDFSDDLGKQAGAAAKLQRELIDEDLGAGVAEQFGKVIGSDLKSAEARAGLNIIDKARQKAVKLADEIQENLQGMRLANEEAGGAVFQPGALVQLNVIQKNLRDAATSGKGLGEVSDAIIRAKNDIAENTALFAKNLDLLKETNPVQFATIKAIRPIWEKLKSASVDEEIFGDLGGALAKRADSLSTLIGATKDFDKNFFEYVKQGGRFERVPDYQKIANFLRNTEATSKEKKRRALDSFQSAVDEVIDKLTPVSDKKIVEGIKKIEKELKKATDADVQSFLNDKLGRLNDYKSRIAEFNDNMAATIQKAKASKADFDKALDIAKEQRAAVLWLNQKESFTGKSLHGALLGGLGTSALVDESTPEGQGLAFLGALGGALLANPRTGLKMIYALENASQGLDRAARKSAVRFRNLSKKLEKGTSLTRAAVVTGRQVSIRDALRFDYTGTAKDEETAFLKHKEALDRLAADPANLYERVHDSLGDLTVEESPATAQAMFDVSARAVAFLETKIPRDPLSNPLIPSDDYTPSFAELDRYARYVQAVKNPRQIFRELEDGDLQPETVEAVKAVYPKVYDSVVEAVASELMGESEIPFDARVQMGILLGLPSVKALTPAYIQTVAQLGQAPEMPAQGSQAQPQNPRVRTSQLVSLREMNVSNRQQRND